LEKKIKTSAHGIEKKLNDRINSEIWKSANQILEEMNSNMKFLFSLPFGIQNNVTISSFVGFRYAYNKPYSHETTVTEMDEIKNSCLPTTILCLGGVDNKNKVLRVVSCGFCSVFYQKHLKTTRIFIMALIGIIPLMLMEVEVWDLHLILTLIKIMQIMLIH
jgi:hypothetical protein